ncbi:MAG: polyamine aminopropyltransferase [Pseudomonadota bacterium]
MSAFKETLYEGYGQELAVEEIYFEHRTDHQHLVIFRNPVFGRVMALDGIVQTTERDEFIYHEMLAHVPILAHGAAAEVLIVGGGDGGMLREVSKHAGVRAVTQVEIDASVIEMSREYLPQHSAGAFDDPRLNLVIADGYAFVRDTEARFDVIIVDSTDPIGPGEQLFTRDFHAACKRCLRPGGIVVTQNGVVFLQTDELRETAVNFAALYADWHFYAAAVPTYVGGLMVFGFATDEPAHHRVTVSTLEERATAIATRYYTPDIHKAAFALPRYVQDVLRDL